MGYILKLRKELKNGRRPIIMTSAGVLIFNAENKLLLQQRTDNGKWGIPGGSMELGETFKETAEREALEEVNLKVKNLELFDVFSGEECHYIYPNGDEIYNASTIFITKSFEGKINLDSTETLSAKFFSKNQLPTMEDINPPDRVVIREVKERIEF
ncbi:MAG: NUDIX hydrolase [Sarcina sp.]